jgi:hypothetical protein
MVSRSFVLLSSIDAFPFDPVAVLRSEKLLVFQCGNHGKPLALSLLRVIRLGPKPGVVRPDDQLNQGTQRRGLYGPRSCRVSF